MYDDEGVKYGDTWELRENNSDNLGYPRHYWNFVMDCTNMRGTKDTRIARDTAAAATYGSDTMEIAANDLLTSRRRAIFRD